MIFSAYIFDRHCDCIFFEEYNQGNMPQSMNATEHGKLIYGVVYSIRNFVNKLRKETGYVFHIDLSHGIFLSIE
jgi:hypothetical protein